MNQPQSQVLSIDAPVSGWDAFHSLDAMPADSAIILDNLIPGAGTCDGRPGYLEYADTLSGKPVETVASYHTRNANALVVASNGGIWEIEDASVQGGGVWQMAGIVNNIAPVLTFANDRWQCSNFRKLDEEGVLIMTNGEDPAQVYDGNTIVPITTTGSDPTLGTADFIGNVVFKGRVYYWKDQDNAFWYSQAGSYQGELKEFNLGTLVQRGGYIKMIVTWTQQDSGDGKDDFLVFVFDTGEILVYQGDDPETVGYWEQVGRYLTGEPMSVRGHSHYGSDTIIITKDGYVGLSTIIQQGRTSDVPAFSRLIHKAVTERTESRGHLYGWDCELYPRRGLFLFNVPLSDSTFEQHVMNTITQKWCRFKGLNFVTFEVNDERLYAGGQDGKIYMMLEGTSDNGQPIQFAAMPAFNYHGQPGNQKHVTAVNFISTYQFPQFVEVDGYADFDLPVTIKEVDLPPIYAPSSWSVYPDTYPPWIPALPSNPTQSEIGSSWDEDFWSSENTPYTTKGWQNVSAYGYAVTVLIRFAEGSDTPTWRSTGLRLHMTGAQ